MDKVNRLFLYSSYDHMCSNRAFDKTCSDPDLHIQDKRVARLLELLQQLNEAAEGLRSLPKNELSEIVSSAVGVCGFVDPIEARDVIAAVLDKIEKQDRTEPAVSAR
jgi:hypothetical protein